MNKNKKRLNLKCWNDGQEYSFLVPLGSTAKLIVECPYCRKKATIDLNPYRQPLRGVYKMTGDAETAIGDQYVFPSLILTQPLEESAP